MKFSKALLGGASFCVAFAPTALAQEEEAQNEPNSVARILAPIQVTATKAQDVENAQDVAVAVTAFNADTLDALKVRDLDGLSYSSPNVSLDQIGTSRGNANFSIRGLGVNSSIASVDPTVGVFVDGVYLGINAGVVFDLFDLDSVELVRGPQGLLFGRNTTGGAVLLNTGNPTDEFEAKARVAVEGPVDDDRGGINSYIQGVVSGPIVEDKLNGKFGVYFNGDSGYFKNLADGENHGEAQTYIYRGALEYTPSDNLTFLGKLEYFDSRGDGPSAQDRGSFDRDSFDFAINEPGFYDTKITTASLRTDWDVSFGNGTVTNIFGYREYIGDTGGDIDASPLFIFHSTTESEQDQISNELRYNGTFGKADVTTGVYYFDQELAVTERRFIPSAVALPNGFYGGGRQDHTVLGLFGQVDYEVNDKLTLTAGIRFSQEDKEAEITYVRPRPECSVVEGTCPITGTNPFVPTDPGNGFADDDDWSSVTPKFGVEYRFDDNTLGYASYTRGFRSGGYNFRITNAVAFEALFPADESRSFDQEEVDAYEAGLKFETADGRGQLNSAVFFTEISDMQREVNVADPVSGVVQNILNTADAELLGLELEGRFAITDNFLVTANLGLIDAEYTDVLFDISSDGVVDGADLDLALPRVPETTYGFGFIYDLDLGDNGSVVTRVNFQHRDEFAYTDNNFGFINEADIVDANIAWQTPIDGVEIALYGKNLLDEVTAGGDTQLTFFTGPFSNGVNAPFDPNPAFNTFSPLNKGRILGIEATLQY